jgi:hypothetical protein
LVEFADDLITVDERCIGGAGLVHTSKFAVFMALKIVVCIGSDFFENVFSVRLVGLGGRRGSGDVDVCPNSGVWAKVALKCRKVVLLSLSRGGTIVSTAMGVLGKR